MMEDKTIIVGAGVMGLLEAAHEVASGRKVQIIEKSDQVGGAWATTDISEWHGVEKGVHYLSPDPRAKAFLANTLGLGIDRMRPKFLVISDTEDSCKLIDCRSLRSRFTYPRVFWSRANYGTLMSSWKERVLRWPRLPMNVISDQNWYLAQGSSSLTSTVLRLCQMLDVPIAFEQEATEVHFVESGVNVRASGRSFLASRVVVPHGVSNLLYRFGASFERQERAPNMRASRPQLLLVFSSTFVERLSEFIFIRDPIVKYAHEVSGYARPGSPQIFHKQRIFAIALHPHLAFGDETPELVFRHLQMLGIIDHDAELVESRLSIEYIPRVDYALARELEHAAGDRLSFMSTENMAIALGENASRWKASLGPLLR